MECGETYPWCPPLRVGECPPRESYEYRSRVHMQSFCAGVHAAASLFAGLVLISVFARTVLNYTYEVL